MIINFVINGNIKLKFYCEKNEKNKSIRFDYFYTSIYYCYKKADIKLNYTSFFRKSQETNKIKNLNKVKRGLDINSIVFI